MRVHPDSGEVDMELGKWWETFQHASTSDREAMLFKDEAKKKRRRSRGRRTSASADAASPDNAVADERE